jgi:hypothetical protein
MTAIVMIPCCPLKVNRLRDVISRKTEFWIELAQDSVQLFLFKIMMTNLRSSSIRGNVLGHEHVVSIISACSDAMWIPLEAGPLTSISKLLV